MKNTSETHAHPETATRESVPFTPPSAELMPDLFRKGTGVLGLIALGVVVTTGMQECSRKTEIPERHSATVNTTHDQVQALLAQAMKNTEGKTQKEQQEIATQALEKARKMLDQAQGNKQ